MRKFLGMTAVLAPIIAAARLIDILFFIDRSTGYIDEGSVIIRAAAALGIIALGIAAAGARKVSLKPLASDAESTNSSLERSSVSAGICFFLAGFASAAASVGTLYTLISSGEIGNALKSGEELLILGYSKLYYIMLLLSVALGIFAAFWFMLVGSWHFRGEGHFAGGRFISMLVAVWYYVRVIKDFVRYPVNPNNTTGLALLFSVLALALFYTKYTKVVSLDFPLAEDSSLFGFGVTAFLWVAGMGAPTAFILVEQNGPLPLFALAGDFFAGVAALSALYARLPEKVRPRT